MNIEKFKNVIINIVAQANILKQKFVSDPAPANYACIFCQSDEEYVTFINLAKQIGKIVQETKTGPLFQIETLQTIAGNLQLLKIREPDSTRPERGDADFTLSNYDEFKKIHLGQEGFKLIEREDFEMIELMEPNFNVRAYFSNPPLDIQLGIS